MKWVVALLAVTVFFGTSTNAQNSRVPEQGAKNGQPVVGSPQTTDPRTRLVRDPFLFPGPASPMELREGPRAK